MIKAKGRPEKDRSERWLLTYADLITLLMVFFVILYSFSIIDVRKYLDLKGSLDKAFNQGVLSGVNTTGINETISGSSVQQSVAAANDSSQASVASQLQSVAQRTGVGPGVTVNQVAQGVTVSLSANVLFQSGTAQLKPGARPLLAAISKPLAALSNPIEIIANTDNVPPAPTNSPYKDNWQLGNARSYAVLRELVGHDHFPENRLSLGNKGPYAPLVPNDSPQNRAKNRRVDVLIVFPRPQDQPIGQPFQLPAKPSVSTSAGSSPAS